ncbi:MAG: cytochrome P450 [bacterium]|nr:cytochrome P450 [bacterium]
METDRGIELTDGLDLIQPAAYGHNGPPHDSWTQLRKHSPLHPCDAPGYPKFWAVTRHADICEISKSPDRFSSEPGIFMLEEGREVDSSEGLGAMRTIITMDPPDHREFRKVASPWFTPRALSRMDETIERSARELVDKLAGETGEGEADFAIDVAAAHPLRVLSTILGVPREEEPRILRLTNQLFGADDEEMRRDAADRDAAVRELGLELYQLFAGIIEDRRKNPRDDLASILANGKVRGELMAPMETFGYYLITFSAGHDTTKNSLAGGIAAMIEHPQQFEKMRSNPHLVPSAVEEIVRWTTPVNYMMRTATCDTDLSGQKIRKDDKLMLFYASANRDEDIFEDPFEFRIDRNPNQHLGFGIGEHFCLGSHLARASQRALLNEFSKRVESLELIGKPEWISSSFVVGLKHLPVRYKIRK